MERGRNWLLLLLVPLSLAACGGDGSDPVSPGATLVAVEVGPTSAVLGVGDTVRFSASGRMSDGATSSVPVSWSATGGSVSAGGLYTAPATAGSYEVVASHGATGLSDTAAVTVSAAGVTVVAVDVTPDSVGLLAGASQSFSAEATLSDATTTGVNVSWSATGGSISAGGSYTAPSVPGTYEVVGVHGPSGLADTSIVTVSGGGGGGSAMVAIQDLATLGQTYYGLQGGLYPGATNTMPAAHESAAFAAAGQIQPLNASGNPDPNGTIVIMSVGMSNTQMETCGAGTVNPANCKAGSWQHRAHVSDAANVNPRLKIVNGARYGHTGVFWDEPGDDGWSHADDQLAQSGVTAAQVQALWIKVVNIVDPGPNSIPDANSDAAQLRARLADIIGVARGKFPNLRMVFLTDRIASTASDHHPEPYAYETSFGVKWAIEDYINGAMPSTPWVGWGPRLWAPLAPDSRLDGLQWLTSDLAPDGVHPSDQGVAKIGGILHDFFKSAPHTDWYRP